MAVPKRINFRSTLMLDAKVFFDWIEVPYQQIVINAAVGSDARATIILEPDPALFDLVPTTPVHVFVRNPNNATEFILAFEGWYTDLGSSRTYNSAHFSLTCVGALTLVGSGSPIVSTVAGIGPIPVTSGTLYTGENGGSIQIALLFIKAINDQRTAFPKDKYTNMAEVVSRFLEDLSTYNLASLIGTWRTNVFSNIVSADSAIIDKFVDLKVLDSLLKEAGNISEEATLLDIVRAVLHKLNMVVTQQPFPANRKPPEKGVESNNWFRESVTGDSEGGKGYNEFILATELSYGAPPACNLIYDATIVQSSSSRATLNEPTRKLVRPGGLARGMVIMAPTISALKEIGVIEHVTENDEESANVFSVFIGKKSKDVDAPLTFTFPYKDKRKQKDGTIISDATTTRNLSGTLLPIERLKGIRLSRQLGTYSSDMALARSQIKETAKADDVTNEKKSAFLGFLQDMSDYQLSLESRSRSVNLSIQGNIFISPGFPALIIDNQLPLYGYVTSTTFTFESDGNHMIEVGMDKCVSLSDVSYGGNRLFGTPPIITPTWGIQELTTVPGAIAFYKKLLGTTAKVNDYYATGFEDAAERATTFDAAGLKALLLENSEKKLSLPKALAMNNRKCVSLTQYEESFGGEFEQLGQAPPTYKRDVSDSLFSLWQTDKVDLEFFLKKALTADNTAALSGIIVANRELLRRYAQAHYGTKSVNYSDADPFTTRFGDK